MQSRLGFLKNWMIATQAGCILGSILCLIAFANSSTSVIVLAPLAITFPAAFLQWEFNLRYFIPKEEWCKSAAIAAYAATAGAVLASHFAQPLFISMFLNYRLFDGVADTWLQGVCVIGFFMGLGFGVPQAYVMRKYSSQAHWWILDNIVGCIVGLTTFVWVVELMHNNIMSALVACFVSPIVFAFITGLTLYNIVVRKRKPKHDDTSYPFQG